MMKILEDRRKMETNVPAVNNKACQVDIEIDNDYESDETLKMLKILEDRMKMETNVPAVNNKVCLEINDEYKSVEVATDNNEDTEGQEGNKKCGTTVTTATKRKCCSLM